MQQLIDSGLQGKMNQLGKLAALLVGASLALGACSTEAALQALFGASAISPVFYGCKTTAEGEAEFLFSREVKVKSLSLDPPMETDIEIQDEVVKVRFNTDLPGGSKIAANMLVEDKLKNTLNVLVSFRTRNNRMPSVLINEIRTEYSKPKVEFIELRTLGAGNLGGMRLFAAHYSDEPIYTFPPAEVKAGEYIVVHTRSIEEGIADETGTNLALSKGTDSSPGARDFWIPGAVKMVHKTNAIYLMDQDDKILSGVLLYESGKTWNERVNEAARLFVEQNAWNSAESADAVLTDGTTTTRTLNRASGANTNSAADWYITATSGATPGSVNNTKRY